MYVRDRRRGGFRLHPRLQGPAEHGRAVDVAQVDGHRTAVLIDVDLAEELQAAEGRQVRLPWRRRLEEDDLGAERAVERVGTECAGVERRRAELCARVS